MINDLIKIQQNAIANLVLFVQGGFDLFELFNIYEKS